MRVLFLLIFYFFIFSVNAQDTIQFISKVIELTKVIEINETSIKYYKYNNLKGPLYTANKSDLYKIKYATGQTDSFNITPALSKESKNKYDLKYINITTNLLQLPINELGLYIDCRFSKRHSIGFSIGKIYANQVLHVNYISADQGTYPGAVWNGYVGRINYKYYFTNNYRWYLGIQFIYKRLSYQNQSFYNQPDGDEGYTFVRNEEAYQAGGDLLVGVTLTKPKSNFNVELFSGLGYRHRVRNYTTISCIVEPACAYSIPLGSFVLVQDYPMFILGLKMGFKTFFGANTKEKKNNNSNFDNWNDDVYRK